MNKNNPPQKDRTHVIDVSKYIDIPGLCCVCVGPKRPSRAKERLAVLAFLEEGLGIKDPKAIKPAEKVKPIGQSKCKKRGKQK